MKRTVSQIYLLILIVLGCEMPSAIALDDANYVIVSALLKNLTQADIISNNVANANTNGFKADEMILREHIVQLTPKEQLTFGYDYATVRDLSQGSLTETGRTFDVAIEGEGFFAIQSDAGPRYTRNGAFMVNPAGTLITPQGHPVLNAGRSTITIPPGTGSISIAEDGTIAMGTNVIDTIGVVTFPNKLDITKVGADMMTTEQEPIPSTEYRMVQGFLEGSNVNGVKQLTKLMEIQQWTSSTAQLISSLDDMRRSAIKTIAKVH